MLDWIGDMGGFFEGLLVIGLLLSSWYTYTFENFLIEHLFVKQIGNKEQKAGYESHVESHRGDELDKGGIVSANVDDYEAVECDHRGT